MAGNKSVALFLALVLFLFLITMPPVLFFGRRYGVLSLPQLTSHNIALAATAGLFAIPVFFIYAAAIIVALKKGRPEGVGLRPAAVARVAVAERQVHYPWEDIFGPEREGVAEKPYRKIQGKPFSGNYKALAAVVVVLAIVGLIVLLSVMPNANNALFGRGPNETKQASITNAASNASAANASEGNLFSRLLSAAKIRALAQPVVKEAKPQAKAPAGVPLLAAVKGFGSKVKKGFLSSLGSVKLRVSKVNHIVWRNMAIAGIIILLAVSVFYSRKSGQLGWILSWFRDWLDWLVAILVYMRKNKLKVLLWVIVVAVVCAAIGAVVFRKWLGARFPSISASSFTGAAVNALFAVRDFVSAYRLYILIGIFALLAIIGILFIYETMGRKK